MSALPPKADVFGIEIDVCFVPKADVSLPCNGYQRLSARAILAGEEQFRLGNFPTKSDGWPCASPEWEVSSAFLRTRWLVEGRQHARREREPGFVVQH